MIHDVRVGGLPVNADGHVGEDTDADAGHLHEGGEGTHDRAEDPAADHDLGECKGHTEARHAEIGHSQVEQKDGQLRLDPVAEDKHHDDEHVTHHGQEDGQRVDDAQHDLHLQRELVVKEDLRPRVVVREATQVPAGMAWEEGEVEAGEILHGCISSL